jgi:hypothetical protein
VTVRLCATALTEWAFIDGYAVSRGIDLIRLPLDRFTNFIWWISTRNAEPPEVQKMRSKLWMPPKGEAPAPQSPWSAENETAGFKALKASVAPGS